MEAELVVGILSAGSRLRLEACLGEMGEEASPSPTVPPPLLGRRFGEGSALSIASTYLWWSMITCV